MTTQFQLTLLCMTLKQTHVPRLYCALLPYIHAAGDLELSCSPGHKPGMKSQTTKHKAAIQKGARSVSQKKSGEVGLILSFMYMSIPV